MVALLIAVTWPAATTARGENFVIRKLKGAGRAIGGVLGAPAGGFAEAAATPTIRSIEGSGRRLLYDFEGVAARRMDQAGDLVGKVVDKTFDGSGKLVDKVDASLEARILQVTTGANATVDNAGQEARATIGAADRMIAANIARARKATLQILDRVDRVAADRLAQIDEIIRLRLGDVGLIVQTTLAQADEIARQRIDQLDEVAGRRIGNLDVIATKQGLGLEAMLLRLATLLGAFAFFAFLMWSAWNNFVNNSNTIDQIRDHGTTRDERRTIKRKLGLWGLQTAFAVACLAAVVGVAYLVPKDAQRRSTGQIADHASALVNAMRAYDFTAVRYHHSQLEILRPGGASLRAVALKAGLLRDLFGRPARLHTADGLREIETELEAASSVDPGDPDLLVLEAYVIWQVGSTRGDELDAADLCARALAMRPTTVVARFLPSTFMLKPLAENYIRQFRHDPYVPDPDQRDALARVTAAKIPDQPSRMAQLQQVLDYNHLVARLDLAVGPAYLEMLGAHATYDRLATARPSDPVAVQRALDARTTAAATIVGAWSDFDHQLATSPSLAGDPTALNAFTLDDAVLSQALYFWDEANPGPTAAPAAVASRPRVPTLPALFFDGGVATKLAATPGVAARKTEDPRVRRRAAAAPMRIRWAHRWASLLGKHSQDVLAKEEAERFRGLERRALTFATEYVELRKAAAATVVDKAQIATRAAAAASAAAAMGLWTSDGGGAARQPAAAKILAEAEQLGAAIDANLRARVTELGRARRLRFL